jgi:hypothetical protein
MFPEYKFTDEDIQKRFEDFYGDDRIFVAGWIPYLCEKLSNLSEFMREIKVGFSRFYNKRYHRRGYFWGDRFKSVIVENGETLAAGRRGGVGDAKAPLVVYIFKFFVYEL